jgi:FeS assembly SUF system protein
VLKDNIIAALKQVYDPEIPVNIYDLGLIYDVAVDEAGAAAVRMSLTAPNCPVAGSLPGEVERRVRSVSGVTDVRVELTFDPPWTPQKMSPDARMLLGLDDVTPTRPYR